MKPFSFTTTDGITIAGIQNEPKEITKRIICLHMMPATKESYLPFMEQVEPLGWQCYAIDFRGHGESTQSGSLDYQKFSNEEHQEYKIEVTQLIMHASAGGKLDAIIGASIGANFAVITQHEHTIPKTVLLSPGLDYYGVIPQNSLKNLRTEQAIYFVAAQEDIRKSGANAAEMAQELFDLCSTPNKKIDIYPGNEHGTDIINNHPDRMQKVIEFFQ